MESYNGMPDDMVELIMGIVKIDNMHRKELVIFI